MASGESLQVWPVGAIGGPFWHGCKDACVCLFGMLEQLMGLFGMDEGRVCMSFLAVGAAGRPFWHGFNDEWRALLVRVARVCSAFLVLCVVGRIHCVYRPFVHPTGWCPSVQGWNNHTVISHEPLVCSKMCFSKTEPVQYLDPIV